MNKPQENKTTQKIQSPPPRKCPRCDSANTKFCYYNNYSLSQPRYYCKGCRRYWTHGGTLRNVPVGGGCRKIKRTNPLPYSSSTVISTNNDHISRTDHIQALSASYSSTVPAAFRSQGFAGLLPAGSLMGGNNNNNNNNMPNLHASTGFCSSLGMVHRLQGMNLQNLKSQAMSTHQRIINTNNPHQRHNDHQQFLGSQIQQRPFGSWATTQGFGDSNNTGTSWFNQNQ